MQRASRNVVQAKHLPIVYGMYSRPGNDPMKDMKENQDSMVVHDEFGAKPDHMFMAVFDGHGPNGGFASQYVRDHLPQNLLSHKVAEDPKRAFLQAAELTSREVSASCSLMICHGDRSI